MVGELDVDPTLLRAALPDEPAPVEVVTYGAADRPELDEQLTRFAGRVCSLAGHALRLRAAEPQPAPNAAPLLARPAMGLRRGSWEPVRYYAVPAGPEWSVFTGAVGWLARAGRVPAADGPARTDIVVLMAAACPHCPKAVAAAIEAARFVPECSVHVVDVQLYPELAAAFHTRTVPTTLIDSDMTLTEVVTAKRLIELLSMRGEDRYGDLAFLSLVAAGRLDRAAALLRSPAGPTRLERAWRQSTTNTRVGLLLAVETALEGAPGCLDEASAPLVPLLSGPDVALVGDTADLLGRIGNLPARQAIRGLVGHPDEDVADLARELVAGWTAD